MHETLREYNAMNNHVAGEVAREEVQEADFAVIEECRTKARAILYALRNRLANGYEEEAEAVAEDLVNILGPKGIGRPIEGESRVRETGC